MFILCILRLKVVFRIECGEAHMYTHIHTYIHTYIHRYIRTYTYIHTYIHAYMHAHICGVVSYILVDLCIFVLSVSLFM